MKKLIIDRFEGNFAVCEQDDKKFINILRDKLPQGVKEGHCLIDNDGVYTIDYERYEERKKSIKDKFGKLFS
jgi:hypothetical protein